MRIGMRPKSATHSENLETRACWCNETRPKSATHSENLETRACWCNETARISRHIIEVIGIFFLKLRTGVCSIIAPSFCGIFRTTQKPPPRIQCWNGKCILQVKSYNSDLFQPSVDSVFFNIGCGAGVFCPDFARCYNWAHTSISKYEPKCYANIK
jgi:hypothetical protein